MGRQSKKIQMQGAQILRNETYLQYVAMTKDEAQRSSWTFYEAVKDSLELDRSGRPRLGQGLC